MMLPKKNYWLINKNTPHLIGLSENAIISGSIKKYDKNTLRTDLDKGNFPHDVFSIPFSYIKSVEKPSSADFISVNFGKSSTEKIDIGDEKLTVEIFNLIREKLNRFEYATKKPSVYRHTKPQIFAILILSGLFLWSFHYANEISKGYEYAIQGTGVGIAGIALGIAQFGKTKIIGGYLSLVSIAFFSFFKKLRSRTLTEYLLRKSK